MIRPILKKSDVYGVQGKIAFDPTKPNANIPLYREIEKFLQGDMGLGGSGGTLANRLKTANSFQASHVFNSPADRENVTERLNKQLTDFLTNKVGSLAKARNMSIPGFLQTQGIHGIKQSVPGDDTNLTAYHRDDFLRTSQNPVTGSTEKLVKAYMRGIGAVNQVSGGTNENRRLTAFLRKDESDYVNKQIKDTAKRINSGLYNKGDLEALYASADQREEVKNKRKTSRNERALSLLDDPESPVMAEMKSKIKLQEAQRKAYKQAKKERVASGEIADDDEGHKGSRGKAGKAAAQTMLAVLNNIKTLSSMVGTMVSLLKKISMDMGRLMADSSTLGIDPNIADRMKRWADTNPTFSRQNSFLLLDAANQLQAKFGTYSRLEDNAEFKSEFTGQHVNMLNSVVRLAEHHDVMKTMDEVFSEGARLVLAQKGSKAQMKQIQTTKGWLDDKFGAGVGDAWATMVNVAKAKGRFNLEHTKNFLFNEIQEKNLKTLSNGVAANAFTGESQAGVNIEDKAKDLNELLGGIAKIQESLIRTLISHTQEIKNILSSIAGFVLKMMVKFDVPGADRWLKRYEAAEKKRAVEEYGTHLTSTLQLRTSAENNIAAYLKNEGVKDADIAEAKEEIFNAVEEMKPLPKKFENFNKTSYGISAIDDIAAYKVGVALSKKHYKDMREGRPSVGGKIDDIYSDAVFDINKYRDFYNTPINGIISRKHIKDLEKINIGDKNREEIFKIIGGKNERSFEQLKVYYKKVLDEGALTQRVALGFFLGKNNEEIAEKKAKQEVESGQNVDFNLFNSKEKTAKEVQKKLQKWIKNPFKKSNTMLLNPDFQRITSLGSINSSLAESLKGSVEKVFQFPEQKVSVDNTVRVFLNDKELIANKETSNEAAQRRQVEAYLNRTL